MKRPTTSASNLHRRKLCPGSERLEEGLPDEESEQSREGSLLHGYDANPDLDRGVLTPYQQDLLRISGELDEQIFERIYEQFAIGPQEPFEGGREKELEVVDEADTVLLPGHCDLWRYWPRIRLLLVIDKKFGYKVVTPAAANIQLRGYAMGGSQAWDCGNVVVGVTQPRLPYEERVTMAVYSEVSIEKALDELSWILTACRQPDAPLFAGEDQCRYCKAKMICSAYADKFTKIQKLAHSIEECTDDQLDQIIEAIVFAAHIADQAKDEARKRIAAGRMKGFKLGEESEVRSVPDARRARLYLKLRGVPDTEILDCMKLGLGAMEDRIRRRTKCTWAKAREFVDEVLKPVMQTKSKKAPILRLGLDKSERPALPD